jgi:hypothetical protein
MTAGNPFEEEGNDDELPVYQAPTPQRQTVFNSPGKASKLESLRIREAELLERQQKLNGARAEIIHGPNYPSFYPVIVFDLQRDIPQPAHAALRSAVYGLMALVCSVCFNILAIICVRGLPLFHHVRSLVFGLIQGFGTAYIVFNYSFSRLYAACAKRDIPFSWVIIQFAVVGWTVYLSIGFPDSGCVGLATFLDLIAKSPSTLSPLIAAINTGLIVAVAFFEFITLYRAQAYQKISGQEDTHVANQATV